jgi:heterodisulfide reductase subunit A-like polyferredoxin
MSILVKWLESMHVDLRINSKCSRNRNVRSTCTFCVESCNSEALSINQQSIEIDQKQCTSCGDCVISCPLSAIEGVTVTREFTNRSLIYKDAFTPTTKELLIYKSRGLTSVRTDAEPLNKQWEMIIKQTNKMLSDLNQSPIRVVQKETNENFSRRAFFTTMQTGGKKLAKSIAPASWKMEANEWNLANYYPEYQFFSVELDKNKCTLCKACFLFCSQNVFTLKDSYLHIESEKCVNCTDCTSICLEDALRIIPEITKTRLICEPVCTKECKDCGQEFYTLQSEGEKCPICVNRDPEWLSPYQ